MESFQHFWDIAVGSQYYYFFSSRNSFEMTMSMLSMAFSWLLLTIGCPIFFLKMGILSTRGLFPIQSGIHENFPNRTNPIFDHMEWFLKALTMFCCLLVEIQFACKYVSRQWEDQFQSKVETHNLTFQWEKLNLESTKWSFKALTMYSYWFWGSQQCFVADYWGFILFCKWVYCQQESNSDLGQLTN